MKKRFLFISLFYIATISINTSTILASPIYRWVDSTGVKNFSNYPASVPKRVFEERTVRVSETYVSSLPLIEKPIVRKKDEVDLEYLAEIKKIMERQLLVNTYNQLNNRKTHLQEQLQLTKNSAIQIKREFDTLIIQGYFSDHSILELKQLQREIKQINAELLTIEPKKEKIVSHAGKRGIPGKFFIN